MAASVSRRALSRAGWLLVLLLGSACAAPCKPSTDWVIATAQDAKDLISALADCNNTEAHFAASWVADVTLTAPIVVGASVTLEVTGEPVGTQLPTADGGGTTRLFVVDPAGTLVLERLRLANGNSTGMYESGGAIIVNGSAAISSCLFEDCTSDYGGGGICIGPDGSATITSSGFTSNNAAAGHGGAIRVLGAAILANSNFTGNTGSQGAAVFADAGASLKTTDCHFLSNSAGDAGGAIYTGSDGNATISSCVFAANDAQFSGGAVLLFSYATVSHCNFTDNYSFNDSGGGLHVKSPVVELVEHCRFTSNSAAVAGGGMALSEDSSVRLINQCYFGTNRAGTLGGGGLYTAGNVTALRDASFSGNFAGGNGGAVMVTDAGGLRMSGCNIDLSTARDRGGGIYADGELYVLSSTVTNSKARHGGGLYVGIDAVALLDDVEFGYSSADEGAAVYVSLRGTVEVKGGSVHDSRAVTYGSVFVQRGVTDVSFANTIFQYNRAAFGGAIYSEVALTDALTNCTFKNSTADESGAAIFLSGSSLPPTDLLASDELTVEYSTAACCHPAYAVQFAEECVSVDGNTGSPGSIFSSPCCVEGQFSNGTQCADCPANFACGAQDLGITLPTLPLDQHYWRASNYSSQARQCWNGPACLGGADPATYCKEGYTGPYCAACESFYSSGIAYHCYKCTAGTIAGTVIALFFAILVIAGVIWYIFADIYDVSSSQATFQAALRSKPGQAVVQVLRSARLSTLRIPLVVWQIITQFVAITGVRLPDLLQNFFAWLNLFNLDFGWLLSISCAFNVGFYGRLLFVTLMPLAIVALLGVSLCVRIRMIRRRVAVGDMAEHARGNWRLSHIEVAVQRHVNVALLVSFLIYSTVSTLILQVFACDTISADEYPPGVGAQSFLRADYSVSCKTNKHQFYEVYAGIMIAIYPLGVPMIYAWTLWRQRVFFTGSTARSDRQLEMDLEREVKLKMTSFLWRPYVAQRYWYEVVECLRRLCLTGLLVFILPGTAGQAAVACVFAMGSLAIFARYSPLKEPVDAQMYILGCAIIFLTMFLGLLVTAGAANPDSQSQKVLSVLVIVLNVILLVVAVVQCSLMASNGFAMISRSASLKRSEFAEMRRPLADMHRQDSDVVTAFEEKSIDSERKQECDERDLRAPRPPQA